MGKVIISPHPIKTKQRIDFNGNVIDPQTKQVIVPRETETIAPPPTATQAPPEATVETVKTTTTNTNPNSGALSILDQIEEAKRNLANLEELKRLEIEKKKKELELLQQ